MLKVGLTGGIASGKTTVAAMFRARGCVILEADRIAHAHMEPGSDGYEKIVEAFGEEILRPDASIDRQRLGAIVFADAARRTELERILHPLVIITLDGELARRANEAPDSIVIVEAALLVEARYHTLLDKLVVTWCRPEQQRERLLAKGFTPEQAEQRIAAQMPVEEKRRLADYVIDCSGSLEETERQVEQVFQSLRRDAASRAPA
ncbi:MAG TPA: dephospho-CoA kinase [Candidatus Xenobia bacterium]|nr:dephospho-CoA kinase [Candidatus Xenobia bacterium]